MKSLGEPEYVDGLLEGSALESGGSAPGVFDGGLAGGGFGDPSPENDPLYDQACDIVLKTRRASISLVQRHLRIGYNRAARLIEQMEQAGMVSAMQTNGNREVLVPAKAE